VDVSGLIGQYAQTNRVITWPILAITLQTWKTNEKVKYILDNFYKKTHPTV
jgi:hypothetical protein